MRECIFTECMVSVLPQSMLDYLKEQYDCGEQSMHFHHHNDDDDPNPGTRTQKDWYSSMGWDTMEKEQL